MLTNLTNLTRSASLTLLTNGTRSLAPVVDGNMLQVRATRSRHVPIPHFGPVSPAGMSLEPFDPESIRIDRPDDIPGSPLGLAGWLSESQPQRSSAWSASMSPLGVRRGRRYDVFGCRVVPVGVVAGLPVSSRAAFLDALMAAAATDHAPETMKAASKRPLVASGG